MGAQKTINKTPLIFSLDCVPLKFLARNLSSLDLSNLCRYSMGVGRGGGGGGGAGPHPII